MTPKSVFLKIATLIEKRPKAFNFWQSARPKNTEKGCGCVLAWGSFFLGGEDNGLDDVAERLLPRARRDAHSDFYDRMARLNAAWDNNGVECAKTLRRYVRRYFPKKVKAA